MSRTLLESELKAAWARQLRHWWHHYNEQYVSGALRAPVLRVGDAEQTLGQWEGSARTLTISAVHIERDPWLAVMETLRHEMAHQYVSEVMRAADERPHGPSFQEACRILRCSPRARASTCDADPRTETEEDAIVRQVMKLLALAESPNEHEAQAAVNKARSLMVRYNLSLVESDRQRQFERRTLGAVKGRHTGCALRLATLLNEFFFVEVIWQASYDARCDRRGTVLEIYGTRRNLDMAEYVYEYLLAVLDGAWRAYKAERGIQGDRQRQRYYEGVVQGFHRKLAEQDRSMAKTDALVWKGDPRLIAYYRLMNPAVRTRYSGGGTVTREYRDGVEEGGRVKPISKSGGGVAGLLKR